MIQLNKFEAIASWLTAGAPPHRQITEILADSGRRLCAAGMALDQLSIHATMIHPELPGNLIVWSPKAVPNAGPIGARLAA